ncbi:MAG: DUF5687 family protein [Bacteroidetes bacterium]|nr:DUF5687 family protein [Bacteroidota bacterium]
MFKWFIRHQWKQATRSSIWQKNVLTNVILGFFLFIIFLELFLVGILIDKILSDIAPDKNPVTLFNGILLYYFLSDLVVRFFIQQLSAFSFEAYLHMPVKKPAIVHYAVLKTKLSIFNILPLFIFIPFAFKVIPQVYSSGISWIWLISVISLVLFNNFFASYLKRQIGNKPGIIGYVALILALAIALDYFHVISLSALSGRMFNYLCSHPVMAVIPVFLMILSYVNYYAFLRAKLFAEELQTHKDGNVDALTNLRYFKTLGLTGEMIALEIKLMWRNKRTRTIIYLFPLFVLYGLFFYPQPIYRDGFAFLIFVGFFMTGGMMLSYINYAFGWESCYFDAILTNNIDFIKYIRIKFMISVMLCTICFIVTLPYAFFGWKIILVNFALYLYNIGFLSFILLYMATFNKKRIDLSRPSAFNYQGISAMNWLAILPGFLLPVLLVLPFRLAGYPYAGILFLGILGVAGLAFHKSLLKLIVNNLEKRKYIMAEGFREK